MIYKCSCWGLNFMAFIMSTGLGMAFVGFLNVIHPFIHGTPLDGGALDACMVFLNQWAFMEASCGIHDHSS